MGWFYMPLFSNKDLCQRGLLYHFQIDFCEVRLVHHEDSGHNGLLLCCREWITHAVLMLSCRFDQSHLPSSRVVPRIENVHPCPRLCVSPSSGEAPTASSGPKFVLYHMIGGVWPPYRNNRTRSLAGEKGLRKTDEVMRSFDLGIKLR